MTEGLARFNMRLTPTGIGSEVEVNGQDVTPGLLGISVETRVDEVTRVTLQVMATREPVQIQGEGVVYVASPQEQATPGEAAATFLADIDPETLEKAMLAELGGLGGGMTTGEAALHILRKWASGE